MGQTTFLPDFEVYSRPTAVTFASASFQRHVAHLWRQTAKLSLQSNIRKHVDFREVSGTANELATVTLLSPGRVTQLQPGALLQ